jgi:Utp11 protein
MISTGTKNGKHIESRREFLDDQTILLMKSQDKNYIKYHSDKNKSKITKLRNNMHFRKGTNTKTIFVEDLMEYNPPAPLEKLVVKKHDKETLDVKM